VKAVIFDWGGVFQRTVDPKPRRQLEQLLGLPPGGVERAVFQSPDWEKACKGERAAEEIWGHIVSSLGYSLGTVDFVRRFFAGDRIDETLVELVWDLRDKGYRVGLLSNAPPPLGEAGQAGRWGCQNLFDVQVFSYQVGVLKPHPRMYETILRALRVAPREALFIDDAPENVRGAQAVGMRALLFTDPQSLLRVLRTWLLSE